LKGRQYNSASSGMGPSLNVLVKNVLEHFARQSQPEPRHFHSEIIPVYSFNAAGLPPCMHGHLGVFGKTKQNNKGFHCVQKICSCFRVVSGGGGIPGGGYSPISGMCRPKGYGF